MTTLAVDGAEFPTRIVDWWGKGVFVFLCTSILLLGVGRFALPLWGGRFSAWSVSRTTFFFWLIWKFLVWFQLGRQNPGLKKDSFPIALITFFAVVTASLGLSMNRDLSGAEQVALVNRVLEDVGPLPGVTVAGIGTVLPPSVE